MNKYQIGQKVLLRAFPNDFIIEITGIIRDGYLGVKTDVKSGKVYPEEDFLESQLIPYTMASGE